MRLVAIDASGSPVRGVTATIGTQAQALGDDGSIKLEGLQPGPLPLKLSAPGYTPVVDAAFALATGPQERVVVIVFDEAAMPEYFAVSAELRAAGIAAEVYLGSSGMKAQMKYADRRASPAAVIIGGDELAAGTVTIKDLDLGRELAAGVSSNEQWQAARPGQQTVARSELVAAVRKIVGRV